MLVADTDFLGAFLKAKSVDIILDIFDENKIVIPKQVEEEILEELGRRFDNRIEVRNTKPIQDLNLGEGERAVISLATKEDLILMNDRKACGKAEELNLKPVTVPGFPKFVEKEVGSEKTREIADKIRVKDNYIFS
ncbi:MAG: hypothetical protein BRC29_00215 [Nanohaloarchaea archaeon SW_7_43_1]|nr:MAG: hypothetical protein BRC29_00215 [Nanohaloarchaea archaeon SW_7_43_1]